MTRDYAHQLIRRLKELEPLFPQLLPYLRAERAILEERYGREA